MQSLLRLRYLIPQAQLRHFPLVKHGLVHQDFLWRNLILLLEVLLRFLVFFLKLLKNWNVLILQVYVSLLTRQHSVRVHVALALHTERWVALGVLK